MDKNAYYPFQFGILQIGYLDNAVSCIKVTDQIGEVNEQSDFSDYVFQEIEEYLAGNRKEFTFRIAAQGTDFQKSVWRALQNIPYGETRTYKEIATAVGNPNASRAVGMANNKNPVAIAIPCHRVVGSNHKLVGYAYGLEMKQALLELEKGNM